MLLVFKQIWDKVNVWGLVALGALGFLFKYGMDKKQQGEDAALAKVNKATQEVTDEWNKIDARPKSVDDAIERLRND